MECQGNSAFRAVDAQTFSPPHHTHNTSMFASEVLEEYSPTSAGSCDVLCLPVQLAMHTLLFAGVNVVVSTLAFIPVMLYGLNLAATGWGVMDAALFGAMLGSTDAVAVAAILKAGVYKGE
jgi:hypothetical protein